MEVWVLLPFLRWDLTIPYSQHLNTSISAVNGNNAVYQPHLIFDRAWIGLEMHQCAHLLPIGTLLFKKRPRGSVLKGELGAVSLHHAIE